MSKSKQGENLRPPINYVQSICLLTHNPQLHNSCILNFGHSNWSWRFWKWWYKVKCEWYIKRIGNECIAINISNIETTVLNTIENEHHDGFRDL